MKKVGSLASYLGWSYVARVIQNVSYRHFFIILKYSLKEIYWCINWYYVYHSRNQNQNHIHQFSVSLTNDFSKIYVKLTSQVLKYIYMDNMYWVIKDLWCNSFHQQLPKKNPIRFAWEIQPDYRIFFTPNHGIVVSIPHHLKNLMFLLFG